MRSTSTSTEEDSGSDFSISIFVSFTSPGLPNWLRLSFLSL